MTSFFMYNLYRIVWHVTYGVMNVQSFLSRYEHDLFNVLSFIWFTSHTYSLLLQSFDQIIDRTIKTVSLGVIDIINITSYLLNLFLLYQSINQSTNQPTDQPIDHSTNQSIDQSTIITLVRPFHNQIYNRWQIRW